MRELFQDLSDMFPYCLLVVLPVFIALSPANPVDAVALASSPEFSAHRAAHYDLGGVPAGSKAAAVNLEARAYLGGPVGGGNLLRKMVVARMGDVSAAAFAELTASGAGGFLLLVPPASEAAKLTAEDREAVAGLEDHLLTTEMQIPVYFSEETEETRELLETLSSAGTSAADDKKKSGAQALLDGILSNGFQLVSASSTPAQAKPQADTASASTRDPAAHPGSVVTLEAALSGAAEQAGEEDSLPTVVVAAHYDASGGAPALSFGADANGSGVTVLMELARVWSHLYRRSSRSRPGYNLVFLLTGGGKINYFGTKRWLDDRKDDANSELLNNVKLAVCLDSLGKGDNLYVHVSKPPKEGTAGHAFLSNLKSLAATLYPTASPAVEMVHKKINLASDHLAWEHERFSIHKLPALTVSARPAADHGSRATILDREVDRAAVLRNAHLLAEALACAVYELKGDACAGQTFGGVGGVSADAVAAWSDELASRPRAASLLTTVDAGGRGPAGLPPAVESLHDALRTYVGGDDGAGSSAAAFRRHHHRRERRDPEFAFYDSASTVVNAYRVKPAVFDLVLTLCISAYLGVVYLALLHSHRLVDALSALSAAASSSKATSNGSSSSNGNGYHANGKVKAH